MWPLTKRTGGTMFQSSLASTPMVQGQPRGPTPTSQRVVKAHRWEHWREEDPATMLHLRNDRRIKMGIALNNYFIFNTDCS